MSKEIIYKGRKITVEELDRILTKEPLPPEDVFVKEFLRRVYDAGGVVNIGTYFKIWMDIREEKGVALPPAFYKKIEDWGLITKIKVSSVRGELWALTPKGLEVLTGPTKPREFR